MEGERLLFLLHPSKIKTKTEKSKKNWGGGGEKSKERVNEGEGKSWWKERSGWWSAIGSGSGTHPRMTDGIFAYHDRG